MSVNSFLELTNAEKMFYKLGYKKLFNFNPDDKVVTFCKGKTTITFILAYESVEIGTDTGEEVFGNHIYDETHLTLDELQAIYAFCKENNYKI